MLLLWNINVSLSCFLLCFHARLFIDALWSPAGKGLTSLLSFVMSNCEVVTFPWYPGSGVVLDCIDSWSLISFLLIKDTKKVYKEFLYQLENVLIFKVIACNCWFWYYSIYSSSPKKSIGYWFLQTIHFELVYLIKYPIVYFCSGMSTIKTIRVICII